MSGDERLASSFDQVEASSRRDLKTLVRAWRTASAATSDVRATAQLTNIIRKLPEAVKISLLAFAVRQLAQEGKEEGP